MKRRAVGLVVAAALLAPGCGGDSDDGDPLDVPPNEFVAPTFSGDADSAFCSQYPRLAAVAGAIAADGTADEVRARVDAAAAAVDDLASVAPGDLSADLDELQEFMDGLAAAFRAVGYEPDRLTRNETRAFTDDRALVAQLRMAAYADQVCGIR